MSGQRPAGPERLAGEVEVEQHRLAVGGQQDVGRLEVEVDQPALVGELQRVGQAGGDPAHRLHVGDVASICRAAPRGGRRQRLGAIGSLRPRRSRSTTCRPVRSAGGSREASSSAPAWRGRSTACTGRGCRAPASSRAE